MSTIYLSPNLPFVDPYRQNFPIPDTPLPDYLDDKRVLIIQGMVDYVQSRATGNDARMYLYNRFIESGYDNRVYVDLFEQICYSVVHQYKTGGSRDIMMLIGESYASAALAVLGMLYKEEDLSTYYRPEHAVATGLDKAYRNYLAISRFAEEEIHQLQQMRQNQMNQMNQGQMGGGYPYSPSPYPNQPTNVMHSPMGQGPSVIPVQEYYSHPDRAHSPNNPYNPEHQQAVRQQDYLNQQRHHQQQFMHQQQFQNPYQTQMQSMQHPGFYPTNTQNMAMGQYQHPSHHMTPQQMEALRQEQNRLYHEANYRGETRFINGTRSYGRPGKATNQTYQGNGSHNHSTRSVAHEGGSMRYDRKTRLQGNTPSAPVHEVPVVSPTVNPNHWTMRKRKEETPSTDEQITQDTSQYRSPGIPSTNRFGEFQGANTRSNVRTPSPSHRFETNVETDSFVMRSEVPMSYNEDEDINALLRSPFANKANSPKTREIPKKAKGTYTDGVNLFNAPQELIDRIWDGFPKRTSDYGRDLKELVWMNEDDVYVFYKYDGSLRWIPCAEQTHIPMTDTSCQKRLYAINKETGNLLIINNTNPEATLDYDAHKTDEVIQKEIYEANKNRLVNQTKDKEEEITTYLLDDTNIKHRVVETETFFESEEQITTAHEVIKEATYVDQGVFSDNDALTTKHSLVKVHHLDEVGELIEEVFADSRELSELNLRLNGIRNALLETDEASKRAFDTVDRLMTLELNKLLLNRLQTPLHVDSFLDDWEELKAKALTKFPDAYTVALEMNVGALHTAVFGDHYSDEELTPVYRRIYDRYVGTYNALSNAILSDDDQKETALAETFDYEDPFEDTETEVTTFEELFDEAEEVEFIEATNEEDAEELENDEDEELVEKKEPTLLEMKIALRAIGIVVSVHRVNITSILIPEAKLLEEIEEDKTVSVSLPLTKSVANVNTIAKRLATNLVNPLNLVRINGSIYCELDTSLLDLNNHVLSVNRNKGY